jgi:hypothetical protein
MKRQSKSRETVPFKHNTDFLLPKMKEMPVYIKGILS